MARIIFRNARVFDGTKVLPAETTVVVEGNRIARVAQDTPPTESGDPWESNSKGTRRSRHCAHRPGVLSERKAGRRQPRHGLGRKM